MKTLAGQALVATDGSGQLHGWQAMLLSLAVGIVFGSVGFALATNYRGLGQRFVDSASTPPAFIERSVRHANLALLGEENVNRYQDFMAKLVGWPFFIVGVLLTGGSLIALVALAIRG